MGMNNGNAGTCETTPRHIWMHEVQSAAIAKGAPAEIVMEDESKTLLNVWYNAGEPIWMAADSIAFASKQKLIGRRADKEAAFLKRMLSR